jgi:hypothetical protein
MATDIRMTFELKHSPTSVRDHMRSASLIEASEKSRGALEVSIRELHSDEHRHEYVISVTNYARGIKGEDRSKRENSTTTVKWDLATNTRRWTWTGEHPVEVNGEDVIVSSKSGATLKLNAQIDVKVPVIGRLIAKKVKEGFEENWPNYVKLVDEFAAKAS